MEEHLIEQWKNKGVSAPTIKLYLFQLRQLNGEPLQDIEFLKDVTKNLERLSKYKTNTIRTKLIAIVAALKCLDHPDLLKEYTEIVKKINDNTDNTSKSETQKENWMNKTEVMDLWKKYDDEVATFANKRKITEKQHETLLRFMILSLYTLISPRRNLDYGRMLIVKKMSPDMSDDFNYLDLKTRSFYFNNYKTKKVYSQQIEQIPDPLWNVIKIYLKFHTKDCDFFLCSDGKPLPHSNSITLILNKIFGKKVGCSMLRNIMATSELEEVQPLLDKVREKAQEMGTSMNTLLTNYIKRT
jgi:hypothetical protein